MSKDSTPARLVKHPMTADDVDAMVKLMHRFRSEQRNARSPWHEPDARLRRDFGDTHEYVIVVADEARAKDGVG